MTFIIQVAGTSGSGKSYLMRSFLKWAEEKDGAVALAQYQEDRKAPIGYQLQLSAVKAPVFVPGAYDVPTGGCDTIHDVVSLYDMIRQKYDEGRHVLFEGLFVMNQTRSPALASEIGRDFCVLQLATPLATCLASINLRRAERGEEALQNKTNTVQNYKRAENYCSRMRDAGARVFRVTRDSGLGKILELLGA